MTHIPSARRIVPRLSRAKAGSRVRHVLGVIACLAVVTGVAASPPADDSQSPLSRSAPTETTAAAADHLIYQPHGNDAALSPHQWQLLWQEARTQGVTTIIVQWTRHGDDDFGGADGWLAQALERAENAGLSLILGLVHDPRYYDILPSNARFAHYWYAQLSRSAKQQKHLIADWSLSPVGWYLPLELDDWLFKDDRVRRELEQQLASASTVLQGPMHLSMFSGGFLTPEAYAGWANTLAATGWKIWWQDGEGTRQLLPAVRRAYRRALPCRVGIISEAFTRISSDDEPFRARPAPITRTPDTDNCHPRATFSLRYMPWAQSLPPGND